MPGSGGGARFIEVLEPEIFPLAEAAYRASTERVLAGASLGGPFVAYALLEGPDLFTGYIASSAATSRAPTCFARRFASSPPSYCAERYFRRRRAP